MKGNGLLTDDAVGIAIEREAEEARVDAFDAAHVWHGVPLKWTSGRESLYYRLRTLNCPLPVEVAKAHRATFLSDAQIIVYLAAHGPADWQGVRAKPEEFLSRIEGWADEHVSTAEGVALIEMAFNLLDQAEVTRAVPRPTSGPGVDPGN